MDLIYKNPNREDVKVLTGYTLDLAYGRDENDFELRMPLGDKTLEPSGFIYFEQRPEYGGIIDVVNPNTRTKEIVYTGRTWHGILDNKVILPDKEISLSAYANKGCTFGDHLTVWGDVFTVLISLISSLRLTDLFEIDYNDFTRSAYVEYQFPRYITAYQGIRKMLEANSLKLQIVEVNRKVKLSVVQNVDYSAMEEWDSSQVKMSIKQQDNLVNHLVCLGTGEMTNRHVIHLYVNGDGSIMPYTMVKNPIKDSEYILRRDDVSTQGLQDISEVYDYTAAETAENYDSLKSKPLNWENDYIKYYVKTSESEGTGEAITGYEKLERKYSYGYEPLSDKPDDWNTNWSGYFEKDGDEFKQVEADTTSAPYIPIPRQPDDWAKRYKEDYYYVASDGSQTWFEHFTSDSVPRYRKQDGVKAPDDWNNNWNNYYIRYKWKKWKIRVRRKVGGIWSEVIKWYPYKVKEVNQKNYKVEILDNKTEFEYIKIADFIKMTNQPENAWMERAKKSDFFPWKTSKYRPFYTQWQKEVPPGFRSKGTVYRKNEYHSAPTFTPNVYYERKNVEQIPEFYADFYYEKFFDHYGDLARNGVKKLGELRAVNAVSITLDTTNQNYDIGDVVGARESVTDTFISAKISKKIIKVNKKGRLSIEYGLGDEDNVEGD